MTARRSMRRALAALLPAALATVAGCGESDTATALDLVVDPRAMVDQIDIRSVALDGQAIVLDEHLLEHLLPRQPTRLQNGDVLRLLFDDDKGGSIVVVTAVGLLGGAAVTEPALASGTLQTKHPVRATLVLGTGGGGGAGGSGGGGAGTAGTAGQGGSAGTGGATGSGGTAGTGGAGGGGAGRGGATGTGGASGAGGQSGSAGEAGRGGAGGSAGAGGAGRGGQGGTTAAGTGGAAGIAGRGGQGGSAGTAGTAGTGGAGRGGQGGSAGSAAAGGSGGGGAAGGNVGSGMVLWYKLDETSGTTAADSSGNARHGTVTTVGTGSAAFSTTHQVGTGALQLNGTSTTNGAYVSIPGSLNAMGATTAITIAAWVNVTTDRAWADVFSFNNSTTTGYMFLTTYQALSTPNSVRFAITASNNAAEQMISSTTRLTTNAWHHIAVVLGTGSTYTGTLYIDGVIAGTNTAMTLRPSTLGNTPNNWIGRSAFAADPYFNGYVDDFRIYNRALTPTEILAVYTLR